MESEEEFEENRSMQLPSCAGYDFTCMGYNSPPVGRWTKVYFDFFKLDIWAIGKVIKLHVFCQYILNFTVQLIFMFAISVCQLVELVTNPLHFRS